MITLMMTLFTGMSYAAQGNAITYGEILRAYNNEALGIFGNKKDQAIKVVENHKAELIKEKDQIESSYIPGFLKIIATSLVASSTFLFASALYGTYGLYNILHQPRDTWKNKFFYAPALTYFEFMKHLYSPGSDKGTMFSLNVFQGKYTQAFLDKMVPKGLENVIELGGTAPLRAGGSLLIAAVSGLLFKKVSAFRNQVAQLSQDIKRDDDIIKALGKA